MHLFQEIAPINSQRGQFFKKIELKVQLNKAVAC